MVLFTSTPSVPPPAPQRDTRRPGPRPPAADEPLAAWEYAFIHGVAPVLTIGQLEILRTGLHDDDEHLLQGATCCPPPMQCVRGELAEGCCVIGYAGWADGFATTVGEVEEFFCQICVKADALLGEPGAVRYFLNWFDETPRDEMRRELIRAIDRVLVDRSAEAHADAEAAKIDAVMRQHQGRELRAAAEARLSRACGCQDAGCCCPDSAAAVQASALFSRADALRRGEF